MSKKTSGIQLAGLIGLSFISSVFHTASAATIVDADSDGLIEINSLDDLNEIRNDLTGKTLYGNNGGCPSTGCFGWELTRDLDFDTNHNGVIDSGDWNGGKSWVPLHLLNGVVFDGNSHSIANFLIATPDIEDYSDGGGRYRYGFIALAYGSTIRNLRLLKPTVLADGSSIPTDYSLSIGSIAASSEFGLLENCTVENATVSFTRPSVLAPMQYISNVGGVVGDVYGNAQNPMTLSGIHFNGSVSAQDDHFAGGITAYLNGATILDSSSQGSITASRLGGIAGLAFHSTIFNTYSTASVTSTQYYAGGLIGNDMSGNFDSIYATGTVTTPANALGGGLIGADSTQGNLELNTSYSNSIVNGSYAQLIGGVSANTIILNANTYQVTDPVDATLPMTSSAYTRSITNDALKCATNPIDTSCSDPYALASWNPGIWDFGSSTELPVLHQDSNYPWVSRDTPNATGDSESFSSLRRDYPQYTCDAPVDFQAKQKKTGYVFSASTPDKFDFFDAVRGLQCTGSKQSNGRCNNYEVSYLCDQSSSGGGVSWMGWVNSHTPSSSDPNEVELRSANPPRCSGGSITGIRARIVGTTQSYNGGPQKIHRMSMTSGFQCLNSDNGGGTSCKDYEVRMVCSTRTALTNP